MTRVAFSVEPSSTASGCLVPSMPMPSATTQALSPKCTPSTMNATRSRLSSRRLISYARLSRSRRRTAARPPTCWPRLPRSSDGLPSGLVARRASSRSPAGTKSRWRRTGHKTAGAAPWTRRRPAPAAGSPAAAARPGVTDPASLPCGYPARSALCLPAGPHNCVDVLLEHRGHHLQPVPTARAGRPSLADSAISAIDTTT